MTDEPPRIIDKKQLLKLVPYSAQYILKLEKEGKFPKRIRVGARRVGWYLDEVMEWIRNRPRGGPPQPHAPM